MAFRIGIGNVDIRNIRNDININTEMTYPVQTINLTAGAIYPLATTIPASREIYNVLPDYGGADANVSVTWAKVGGHWYIYLESSEAINGVKVKIIYK